MCSGWIAGARQPGRTTHTGTRAPRHTTSRAKRPSAPVSAQRSPYGGGIRTAAPAAGVPSGRSTRPETRAIAGRWFLGAVAAAGSDALVAGVRSASSAEVPRARRRVASAGELSGSAPAVAACSGADTSADPPPTDSRQAHHATPASTSTTTATFAAAFTASPPAIVTVETGSGVLGDGPSSGAIAPSHDVLSRRAPPNFSRSSSAARLSRVRTVSTGAPVRAATSRGGSPSK